MESLATSSLTDYSQSGTSSSESSAITTISAESLPYASYFIGWETKSPRNSVSAFFQSGKATVPNVPSLKSSSYAALPETARMNDSCILESIWENHTNSNRGDRLVLEKSGPGLKNSF